MDAISERVKEITTRLKSLGITVKYDNNDTKKPGWKFAEYELKGVPVRIAIGPRDLENGTVEVARRDTLEKQVVNMDGIELYIQQLLADIQANIYKKAFDFRTEMTTRLNLTKSLKKCFRIKEVSFQLIGMVLRKLNRQSKTKQSDYPLYSV